MSLSEEVNSNSKRDSLIGPIYHSNIPLMHKMNTFASIKSLASQTIIASLSATQVGHFKLKRVPYVNTIIQKKEKLVPHLM